MRTGDRTRTRRLATAGLLALLLACGGCLFEPRDAAPPATGTLLRDVRLWLRVPGKNHGWLLAGDEREANTVTRFDSREQRDPELQPLLAVTYRERRVR